MSLQLNLELQLNSQSSQTSDDIAVDCGKLSQLFPPALLIFYEPQCFAEIFKLVYF